MEDPHIKAASSLTYVTKGVRTASRSPQRFFQAAVKWPERSQFTRHGAS